MTRLCNWRCLGMLLIFMGIVGCDNRVAPQPKYSARGFGTSTDGFAISGGHLVVHPGKPGVTFGTMTMAKSPQQLTYVVLFKLPPPTKENALGLDGHARSHGRGHAETK